ncbi:NADPH-dependent oxidoreductase [Prevotella brunnea]|uniref:NADPH-dependent oxidoreductase n=1 Tax=Prevotella brunnea TaxID=2508867 RepID=A0A5C8GPC4_9BACT|nr:nitroreductase family protein [Prevotella brunnea]MDR0186198.1 NADPH-dependent oxidoreductase [Prevotella brunnea]TXJ62872.1 NADPH-dependent oxidoreductase [Prevotella brunnea]
MKTIQERRTIRKYSDRELSETFLKDLLSKAERAPTMGNLQLYSVVMTTDSENKRRLAPAHFHQPMVENAPCLLTFCADFRRTSLWAEERNATPGYDNFLSFMNAATDALLYCQTFTYLAESEGLGTCFLGTTIYNSESIVNALHLPRLVMPVATLTVGWPAEEGVPTDRLPIEGILHAEKYEDYTSERIDRFYFEKENREENKHFVEINNKETLAQVFTDLRYKKEDNESMSVSFLATLKRQGFL